MSVKTELTYPTAANLAMTRRCQADDQLRRVADWTCYMGGARVRIVPCLFWFLLCVQGICQTSEQAPLHRPSSLNSLEILAGTFESAVRGDSLFGDRTSTNSLPLFTLTLETNGTYSVFCASVFIVPLIDGGGSIVPGYEFGRWKWVDRHHFEVVFTATNRIHMAEAFPTHMRVDLRDLSRLTAINTAPPKDRTIPHPWVPLTPPYFYRKVQ